MKLFSLYPVSVMYFHNNAEWQIIPNSVLSMHEPTGGWFRLGQATHSSILSWTTWHTWGSAGHELADVGHLWLGRQGNVALFNLSQLCPGMFLWEGRGTREGTEVCKSFFKSLHESYLPMLLGPKQDTKPIRINRMGKQTPLCFMGDTTSHMTKEWLWGWLKNHGH